MNKKQKHLCSLISHLPKDVSVQTFHESLHSETPTITPPSTTKTTTTSDEQGNNNDDFTTPLLLACETSHIASLQYMLHTLGKQPSSNYDTIFQLWGRPTEQYGENGGNTSFHAVAMVGCTSTLDLLIQLMKLEHHNRQDQDDDDDYYYYHFQSMSLVNFHGDTPIMMACVAGHVELLRHWISPCKENTEQMKRIMNLSNDSSDTALSLAFGYGNNRILDFLLNENDDWIIVDYSIYQKCQSIQQRTDKFLTNNNINRLHKEKIPHYKQKIKTMKIYLQVIHEKLIDKCNQSMNELLLQEQNEQKIIKNKNKTDQRQQQTSPPPNTNKKKKSKPKKRKKTKPMDDEECAKNNFEKCHSNNKNHHECNSTTSQSCIIPSSDNLDNPKLPPDMISKDIHIVPDQDGFKTNSNTHTVNDKINDNSKNASKKKSSEAYIIPRIENQTEDKDHSSSESNEHDMDNSTIKSAINSLDSEAVMNALCLDASMLLLTPHGMAMHLSPSQLEAIEKVLLNQLGSVEIAKMIQSRLRTNFNNKD